MKLLMSKERRRELVKKESDYDCIGAGCFPSVEPPTSIRPVKRWVRQIKLFWWYLQYTLLAMKVLRCSPSFAWKMATACGDENFTDGWSAKDSLDEELSYWAQDAE